MKVAIFTDTFLPQINGVVTCICNSIKELRKRGIEVIVFAPGKTTHMETYEGARVYMFKSMPVIFYRDYLLVNLNEMFIKVKTLLDMEMPDVYHIQDPFVMGFVGMYYARRFRKPLIGTYHTLYEEYAAHLSKGKYKKVMQYVFGKTSWSYIRLFFSRCGVTIAPGNEIAKVLIEHGITNVKVIPNGIDFDRIKNTQKFDIRKIHKIPRNAKIILNLGRISFEKKIEVLLKAFKELNNKNYYLLIVGKGPSLKNYENMAKTMNLKNVIFTDYVDDKYIASYYNAADIFAMPSDTETFSLVTLEALAAGKPVVGPNYLGTKDLIIDNFNGLKFNRGDYIDMAAKISLILNNNKLKNSLGKNAKKFSEKYSIEKTTNQLIDVYKNTKHKPFELNDLFVFWPKIKLPKINEFKNGGLLRYLKRIKFQF